MSFDFTNISNNNSNVETDFKCFTLRIHYYFNNAISNIDLNKCIVYKHKEVIASNSIICMGIANIHNKKFTDIDAFHTDYVDINVLIKKEQIDADHTFLQKSFYTLIRQAIKNPECVIKYEIIGEIGKQYPTWIAEYFIKNLQIVSKPADFIIKNFDFTNEIMTFFCNSYIKNVTFEHCKKRVKFNKIQKPVSINVKCVIENSSTPEWTTLYVS